jgi:hypothetical protein
MTNRLKLNPTKTEFAVFGSRQQLDKCHLKSINVSGSTVGRSSSVKYLTVHLHVDETLSFREQISTECKTALFNLSRIKSIRKYLDLDTSKTLLSSLVLSHLDYSNVLYFSLPDCDINEIPYCLSGIPDTGGAPTF